MEFTPTKPHKLQLLPPSIDFKDPKFTSALLKAQSALAELKGYSFAMPNPLLLLSPAILRESLASSEIENIHTTLIDVLQNQLFPEAEQRESDKEVLRYRDAVLWGFEQLDTVPFSTRLILGIQKKLLPKGRGAYRSTQNAIGNRATGEILYMPPLAADIQTLMQNWEQFVNNTNDDINPLLKAAVAHYQFEAIHPFDDGNGRTGRILIVLYLIQAGLLRWPILYISGYLERNRSTYYKLLRTVTQEGGWDDFILFILEGFHRQALETQETLLRIIHLFESLKKRLKEHHRKIYSADLVEVLFSYPVVTPVKLARELGIHYTTATRYLVALVKAGVLDEKKHGKYRLFINKDLLNMINKNTVGE